MPLQKEGRLPLKLNSVDTCFRYTCHLYFTLQVNRIYLSQNSTKWQV